MEVREAAIQGAEVRMRPIFITSLTTMAGASTILSDPIFQGLAVSTLFGAGVGTVLALLVIPLGCISARKQFYVETLDDGTMGISSAYQRVEKISTETPAKPAGTPLWMRLYGGIISAFTWVFYIIRAVFTMIGMGFKALLGGFGRRGGTHRLHRGSQHPVARRRHRAGVRRPLRVKHRDRRSQPRLRLQVSPNPWQTLLSRNP